MKSIKPTNLNGLWSKRRYQQGNTKIIYRTQIKIRNKFYGAIRNLVRFLIKYFKVVVGSWSLISNKIRPEILQNLYGGVKGKAKNNFRVLVRGQYC